jgi:LysR family transcriptional regulator, nod-box dependent transcriptional activator
MRFNRLDLNLLVCLDALIAERSVTKAAARVFIGQPAMSLALRRLRVYFKDDLLVQVGRTMTPSPLAQRLARPVRDVLLQMHAVTSATPEFDPTKSDRRISLVASDYVATVFLTALIARMSSAAPHMKFDLRTMSVRYREEFDSGEVEMLIAPSILLVKDHPSEPLFEDTFSCVAWSENPVVGRGLSVDQYLSMGHVGVEWGAGRLRSLDEEALQRQGRSRRIEVVVPDFNLVVPFVAGTTRIGTIQTRLAILQARQYPVRVLRCPVRLPGLNEAVQWHKHVDRDPAVIWFRAQLKTVAANLSGRGRRRPQ